MQTFTFRHTTTGEIISIQLRISEYDDFKKAYPDLERYFDAAPAITFNGKSFGGVDARTDGGWKERLAKIGEKFPGSPLADRYNKKTDIKKTKTKEIIKQHVKKHKEQTKDRMGR